MTLNIVQRALGTKSPLVEKDGFHYLKSILWHIYSKYFSLNNNLMGKKPKNHPKCKWHSHTMKCHAGIEIMTQDYTGD